MITRLKSYEQYKESGSEWLGKVPQHWDVRRLKSVVSPFRPITYGIVQCGEHVSNGVPYIRPVDINANGIVIQSELKRTTKVIAASYKRSEIRGGDVVISIGPSFGKVMLVPDSLSGANLTQGTARIAPGHLTSAEYVFWLIRSRAMHNSMAAVATGSTFLALNLEPLGRIRVPIPLLEDQAAIVRFLNWADGRLERAVRAKRKVITLLEEQKQAIIYRAVTRGLDPSVPLKPSGVSWIGHIPQHWQVRRAKFLLTEVDARSSTGSEQLLRVSQYTGVSIRNLNDSIGIPQKQQLVGYKLVRADDLVVNIMIAWNGSLGISRYDGIVSPAYCVYRFIPAQYPWFFHYLLRTRLYGARIKQASTGVIDSRLRLYSDALGRIEMLVPPNEEQIEIVRSIDSGTIGLNRSISALTREIDVLNEYRARLVTDVVTGKLDVREAAALLPDEVPLGTVEDAADLGEDLDTVDEEATA